MKKIFTLIMVLASAMLACAGNVAYRNVSITDDNGLLRVEMDVDLSRLKVKGNEIFTVSPVVVSESRIVRLPEIEVMGRKQYIMSERDNAVSSAVKVRRQNGKEQTVHYSAVAAYEDWFEGATLEMREGSCGCCRENFRIHEQSPLAKVDTKPRPVVIEEPAPVYDYRYAYVEPEPEPTKIRHVEGSAYIQYPVNSTVIRSDYRDNMAELVKINRTIDAVKQDSDVVIRSLTIKGYASPEGSYASNLRLAKGRTEALVAYVGGLHDFGSSLIKADWEAEDWNGLRAYVENSGWSDKVAVLSLIDDSSMSQDAREQRLRTRYPAHYRELLGDCYPKLRHTDYNIEFKVRSYSLDEARIVMLKRPERLSQLEMYRVAQSYPEGSVEAALAYDAAAGIYPDNATACTNAANSALQRDELALARTYLANAGDSPEALNARGVLAAKDGDKDAALALWRKAADAGCAAASHNINEYEK